ncbi:hypothetical protein ACB092_05G268000 [Castanea dentata]
MSDYLSPEVIGEILLELPAKSVLRFRSVCKTWYSLISNSRFANAYLARSNQRSSPYFLFGRRENEKVCFSLHSNPAMDSSDFIEFHPPYENYGPNKTYGYGHLCGWSWSWNNVFQIVGSVNGLICLVDSHYKLYEKYFLWNPSINRTVQLPFVKNLLPEECNYCHGFGYHAPTNEYKVARIMHFDDYIAMVEICALNSSREWHSFKLRADFYLQGGETSVFMNGRLHWLAQKYHTREDYTRLNFILSFDLGFEIGDENIVYHEVPIPKVFEIKEDQYSLDGAHIAMLNGLLALYGWLDETYDVWVMKEYGVVESWTKLYIIDYGIILGRVIGFKKNGEVLVTRNDRDLLLYEPNSQRIIWDLQKNYVSSYFYLDNYVESLVLFDTDGV